MFTCISELLNIAPWTKLDAQCSQIYKSIAENIPRDLELAAPGRKTQMSDYHIYHIKTSYGIRHSVCNGTLREYLRHLQG